jgi:predicted deacetylase
MLPKPAQYLLRIDDLCPTVSAEPWQRFQMLVQEFQICPILAVVPDNRDDELRHARPDPDFWPHLRELEAAGATIAPHGYRHLCASYGGSLIPLHRQTEFAGVPAATQQDWIHEGLAILRSHGLNPRIWVAPRHGFDQHTLNALHNEGIHLLSDGLARIPFTRDGLTWIPQQLWAPVKKANGLWTICIHPNTVTDAQIAAFRVFLSQHTGQFTSVDRVLAEFSPTRLNLAERAYAQCALWRIQASRTRKPRSLESPPSTPS